MADAPERGGARWAVSRTPRTPSCGPLTAGVEQLAMLIAVGRNERLTPG
jgi:hypothetical protein